MNNCPTVANADQADANGDGFGDACVQSRVPDNVDVGANPLIGQDVVLGQGGGKLTRREHSFRWGSLNLRRPYENSFADDILFSGCWLRGHATTFTERSWRGMGDEIVLYQGRERLLRGRRLERRCTS
jgi:hypothetical protein